MRSVPEGAMASRSAEQEGTAMGVAPRTRNSGGRSSGTLSRQRVDAIVDQLWQYRLTLVVAPAGSGKTTALRHFATRASPVAWCSADALETAPDGCLGEIARLVGSAIGAELDGSSVTTMIAGLDAWPGQRVALIIVSPPPDCLH